LAFKKSPNLSASYNKVGYDLKHQVALCAAAGVINTTTTRPKILLILENGNI
jgi:hypothetical protein